MKDLNQGKRDGTWSGVSGKVEKRRVSNCDLRNPADGVILKGLREVDNERWGDDGRGRKGKGVIAEESSVPPWRWVGYWGERPGAFSKVKSGCLQGSEKGDGKGVGAWIKRKEDGTIERWGKAKFRAFKDNKVRQRGLRIKAWGRKNGIHKGGDPHLGKKDGAPLGLLVRGG